MYEVPDDVIAILNNQIATPPHIALELMIAHGIARKLSTFTTSQASELEQKKSVKKDKKPKHTEGPWAE
jgi:hypothetical protein